MFFRDRDHHYSNDPFPIADGDRRFGTIDRPYGDKTIDDAILGEEHAAFSGTVEATYVGLAVSPRTLRAVFGGLSLVLLLILGRAGQLQVVHGARYAAAAEDNRSRIELVPAERGVMYDRRGKPLVRNIPDFSVTLTLADLPKDPAARAEEVARVADILDVEPLAIEERLEEFKKYPGAPVLIARGLTHDQAVRISVESAAHPGVALETGLRREYLTTETPSLSHVLGYQGRITEQELEAAGDDYLPSDLIGKAGLEKSYEALMRGIPGVRRTEIDAKGREKDVIADEAAEPGKNLVLTIDADLQTETERILTETLKKAGKTRASVIVMDPRSGDVLTLVSLPAYDHNLFAKGIPAEDYKKLIEDPDHPLFSRAIAGSLPAGSTFKISVAAAALEEGIVTPSTSVLSSGGLRVGGWFFPDWKAGGHGTTDVRKAIAESVNTFFYMVGGGTDSFKGLGLEKMVEYAQRFGLGAPLGIDLPGETAGFLPTKEWKKETRNEQWYIGDTYHVAIGQGDVLVTPLQIAGMTAAVANDGTLMRPRLVQATTSADGSREERDTNVVRTGVVSQKTLDVVQQGMRRTVTDGSGRFLKDLPIEVAGKTGTAQWNSKKENHAWFTSFAPYENPEVVVTVVVEEGVEGSAIAVPIAKQIYQAWLKGRRP